MLPEWQQVFAYSVSRLKGTGVDDTSLDVSWDSLVTVLRRQADANTETDTRLRANNVRTVTGHPTADRSCERPGPAGAREIREKIDRVAGARMFQL